MAQTTKRLTKQIAALLSGWSLTPMVVMRTYDESTADDVAVPARELEPVRATAEVRPNHDDLAIVDMPRPFEIFAS